MADESTHSGKPERPRRAIETPRHSVLRWVVEFAIYLVVAILVLSLVRVFLVQPFRVPTGSMEQTVEIGDTIVAWRPGEPERGMIVVFRDDLGWLTPGEPAPMWKRVLSWVKILPNQDDQFLVKRLIGLPGDHVSCCDTQGRLSVNGQALDEPYLYYATASVAQRHFDVVVPSGHIFVMGDHRDRSADSRYWMCSSSAYPFPSLEAIQGKAVAIMRPLSRAQWFDIPPTFAAVPEPTGTPPSPDHVTGTCT